MSWLEVSRLWARTVSASASARAARACVVRRAARSTTVATAMPTATKIASVTTFSGSAIYQVIAVVVLYFATRSVQTPSMRSFLGLGLWAGIMTQFRSEFFTFGFALDRKSTRLNSSH